MPSRRVVITGLGWVTSLGLSVDEVWKDLVAGKSGIQTITRFDVEGLPTRFAGEVCDWTGGPNVEKRHAKRLDRFAQFALNASIDAVNDSGLDFDKEDPWRCGAIIGSGVGGMDEFSDGIRKMITKGPDRVSPFMIPKLMCNAGSGNVAIQYGLKGPNCAVASACASGAHAIGESARAIACGTADVMITGGSEAAVSPIGLAGFSALKALSTRNDDPKAASRPFDRDRDGFILSEGAGIIILEDYEHASNRGATIYAEVLGYGQSCDGFHITAPDEQGSGAAHSMKAALEDAGLDTADVDYINAHGTSTPMGDAAELLAMQSLFGDNAKKIPIGSSKSMTGHVLGATGGIEAIIATKSLKEGVLTPTINFEQADEGTDLDFIPNTAREANIRVAMSNSFGFGGHNVSLVFGKV